MDNSSSQWQTAATDLSSPDISWVIWRKHWPLPAAVLYGCIKINDRKVKMSGGESQLVNNAGTELDIVELLWCETTTKVVWFSVNDPLLPPPPLILTLLRHRLWWTKIHIEKLQVKNDNLDWPFTLTVQCITPVRLFCVHCSLLSGCVGFCSCLFDKMTDCRRQVKKKCGFF